MPSTRRSKTSARRQMFLKLAGQIESQLRDAYARQHEKAGLTQTALSKKIGVNRSAITHRLMGKTNMTVETIADMVWGLDHDIHVKIFDPTIHATVNYFVPIDDDAEVDTPDSLDDKDRIRRVEYESVAAS